MAIYRRIMSRKRQMAERKDDIGIGRRRFLKKLGMGALGLAGSKIAYGLLGDLLEEKGTDPECPPEIVYKRDRDYGSLRTFGREDPIYSEHDWLFTKFTDYWNEEFRDLPGYSGLDPNLVKAMALVETGSKKHKYAWESDPMQISNMGDFALKELSGNGKGEHGIPPEGYGELCSVSPAPKENGIWQYDKDMNPAKSIKFGTRWLWHKRLEFSSKGEIIGMKGWREAVYRYNGGGNPHYVQDVERIYGPVGR